MLGDGQAVLRMSEPGSQSSISRAVESERWRQFTELCIRVRRRQLIAAADRAREGNEE